MRAKRLIQEVIQGLTLGVTLTIAMLASPGAGKAQQGTAAGIPSGVQNPRVPFGAQDPISSSPLSRGAQEQLEKGRQNERQKKLIADTDRLLALSTELKAEMDKTTKDTMSIQVIKKAEEIEKLARSVKDRMKG